MSYTATTIGFGEIPYPFTYNQRMWVTISIYLTVIGWAYAIGSLLALLQDRAFRSGAGAAALHPQGRPAARAVRADRRLRAHRGAARALVRRAGPAVRRPRRDCRADRRPGAGLLPRRRARAGRRRARPRTPRPSPGLGHSSLRGRRRPDRRRRGQPRRSSWRRRCCAPTSRSSPGSRRGAIAERMQAFGNPSTGQPVRPLRRPPAARPAGAGLLPAADLAGERPGRRAARRAARRRGPAAGSSAATAGSAGS